MIEPQMDADERRWVMPLAATTAAAFAAWLAWFFANGGTDGWLDRSYKRAMDAAGETKVREHGDKISKSEDRQ